MKRGIENDGGAIVLYVDADACPVKAEVYRVAERHSVVVYVVSNGAIVTPRDPRIRSIAVGAEQDAADNWIAERVGPLSIVVTNDLPLAARCVKAGAIVIAANGRVFDDDSIGLALANRNLMADLRSAGEITGGPRAFSQRDRSTFLSALHEAVVKLTRAATP